MYVILNTDEIVQRYMAYDSLFSFYENGVKDVVKDAVFETGKRHKFRFMGERHLEAYWDQSLAGRTARAWEEAIDMALDHSPQSVQDYQQGHHKVDRDVIHLVADQIEEEIERLVLALVKEKSFKVLSVDPSIYNEWIGNDLVVEIARMPEEYDGCA